MASFSFGTGNAAKLMRAPLYAAGFLGTLFVPRGARWVFGSAVGVADGALALWRVASAEGHDTVWLTDSDAQRDAARALGIPAVRKTSLRGWWTTARAGVVVVTHGFGDANAYALSGAFVVQLWHGIPLKRIGLDSPATSRIAGLPGAGVLRRVIRMLYRSAAQRIRVLPAASHRVRGRLESAFGLDESRVVVTGEPRVDVLSAADPDQRRAAATELLRQACGSMPTGRVILYAPTWRDGADDPAIPTATDWLGIIRVLERHDAVLLVRPHPLGAGAYTPPVPSRRVRMLGADRLADVTPALPGVDVLVTDYSSLAFDAGLLALPVLYLAPDAEGYAWTRGFYGRYEDVAIAPARDWAGLLDQLDALLRDEAAFTERSEQSATLSAKMHAYRDGGNTRRVYEAIRARGIPAPKGAV